MTIHGWFDAYWHPMNNGLRWHTTRYARYISIWRFQINICKSQ
jgi:hypothetical protein